VGNRTRPLEELQVKLQYTFSNPDLLIQALKHRSYVYAAEENSITSNERLEFLGDAVLDLIVTEYLYQKFPKKREGELTQIKSLLVSKVVLAERSNNFGLGEFLLLSKEETQAGGRKRTSIIGDAFEALLGAIYLDGGLLVAQNFKSVLLEHTQSEGKGHPRYLVNAEEGPDHRKMFSVEVLIGGISQGVGQGRSKKEAQQMAARDALEKMGLH
jgi:ribonuclease-3